MAINLYDLLEDYFVDSEDAIRTLISREIHSNVYFKITFPGANPVTYVQHRSLIHFPFTDLYKHLNNAVK